MFHIFPRGSTLGLIFGYDIFTALVMTTLIFLSIFSWAVIIYKSRSFKRIVKANQDFLERFKKRNSFDDAFKTAHPESPLFAILAEGLTEAQRLSGGERLAFPLEVLPNIQAAMERAIGDQVEIMGNKMIALATVTNISPLLGLLGTVWGIMVAFVDIKNFGSSSIQVVAPGIAEALVTTIAGLVVAIPCVFFHSHFSRRIEHLAARMEVLVEQALSGCFAAPARTASSK